MRKDSKHRTTRKIKVILTTWSQNEIVFVNAGKKYLRLFNF